MHAQTTIAALAPLLLSGLVLGSVTITKEGGGLVVLGDGSNGVVPPITCVATIGLHATR